MSSTPVETVRRVYALMQLGQFDSVIEWVHPDIVIREEVGPVPYSGVYHGIEGFHRLGEVMLDYVELSGMNLGIDLFGENESVISVNEVTFRSGQTGRSVTLTVFELFRFKDGKIIEIIASHNGSAVAALHESN